MGEDDRLLRLCGARGAERHRFVFAAQRHRNLDLQILRQHPPEVKGQLAGRALQTQRSYKHIGRREAFWENVPGRRTESKMSFILTMMKTQTK